jgi:hypothetical protein
MKTDEEVRELLRRASQGLRVPDCALERLYRRRTANHHRQRVTAAVVALLLFGGVVGGALFALQGARGGGRAVPGSGRWTPGRPLELMPGQFFYLKGTTYGIGDGSVISQETWWSPDGSGELRFETNRSDKYTPYPPAGVYDKGSFPLPNQDDLSSLSTDPTVLLEQVRQRADRVGESDWRAVLQLLDFDRSPQALPELRAALFEVTAGLEGVTREDGGEDPVGREAVALKADEVIQTIDDSGEPSLSTMHWELFFDPGTHQLMAEAVGSEGPPVPFMILMSGIVDSRGAAPTGEQLLFPNPIREFVPPPAPRLP